MASLPPLSPGLLPYWLLAASFLSIFNTITCYTSPSTFLRSYPNPFPNTSNPPTSSGPTTRSSARPSSKNPGILAPPSSQGTLLPARIFGIWTLLACILRTYAAFALHKPDIYAITLSTYILALGHFSSECFIYGTTDLKAIAPMLLFSTSTTAWMIVQWGQY